MELLDFSLLCRVWLECKFIADLEREWNRVFDVENQNLFYFFQVLLYVPRYIIYNCHSLHATILLHINMQCLFKLRGYIQKIFNFVI